MIFCGCAATYDPNRSRFGFLLFVGCPTSFFARQAHCTFWHHGHICKGYPPSSAMDLVPSGRIVSGRRIGHRIRCHPRVVEVAAFASGCGLGYGNRHRTHAMGGAAAIWDPSDLDLVHIGRLRLGICLVHMVGQAVMGLGGWECPADRHTGECPDRGMASIPVHTQRHPRSHLPLDMGVHPGLDTGKFGRRSHRLSHENTPSPSFGIHLQHQPDPFRRPDSGMGDGTIPVALAQGPSAAG